MRRLMTIPEVAVLLNVSRARAYDLARTGVIKTVKLGLRQIRVSPEEVERFVGRGRDNVLIKDQ